jgi:hypothetical protein
MWCGIRRAKTTEGRPVKEGKAKDWRVPRGGNVCELLCVSISRLSKRLQNISHKNNNV